MADDLWLPVTALGLGFVFGLLHSLWLWRSVRRLRNPDSSATWLTATLPARLALPLVGLIALQHPGWAVFLCYLAGFAAARQVAMATARPGDR